MSMGKLFLCRPSRPKTKKTHTHTHTPIATSQRRAEEKNKTKNYWHNVLNEPWISHQYNLNANISECEKMAGIENRNWDVKVKRKECEWKTCIYRVVRWLDAKNILSHRNKIVEIVFKTFCVVNTSIHPTPRHRYTLCFYFCYTIAVNTW